MKVIITQEVFKKGYTGLQDHINPVKRKDDGALFFYEMPEGPSKVKKRWKKKKQEIRQRDAKQPDAVKGYI